MAMLSRCLNVLLCSCLDMGIFSYMTYKERDEAERQRVRDAVKALQSEYYAAELENEADTMQEEYERQTSGGL